MGLKNTGAAGGGSIYTALMNGYWGKKCQDGVEGAVQRKKGGAGKDSEELVSELRFDELEGVIQNAYMEAGEYGVNLFLEVESEGVTTVARMGLKKAKVFLQSLDALDVTKEVQMQANLDDGGYGQLWVKQDGKNLVRNCTKSNPDGSPEVKQVTKQGKKVWDYDAYDEFMYNKIEKWCSNFEGKPESKEEVDESGF